MNIWTDVPNHSIPSLVGQVEDQIFWLVIHWTPQHSLPVFQVGPRLFGRATREGREPLKKSKSNDPHINGTDYKRKLPDTCHSRKGIRTRCTPATSSPQSTCMSFRATPRVACYTRKKIISLKERGDAQIQAWLTSLEIRPPNQPWGWADEGSLVKARRSMISRRGRTYVTWFGHSNTLVDGSPFQGTSEDKVLILDLVELDDQ